MRYDPVQKVPPPAAPRDDDRTTNDVAIAMDDAAVTHPRGGARGGDGADVRALGGDRYTDHAGSDDDEDDEDDDVPLTAKGAAVGAREDAGVLAHGVAEGAEKKAAGVAPDLVPSSAKGGPDVRPADVVKEVVLNSRAAMRLFELVWTVLAIFFVAQLLHVTGYIPQHGKDAANLIQQTKVWMAGDPDAQAWHKINTKSQLLDTLNSTVFMGMFRTHITHIVYHSTCNGEYYRRRRLESEPSWRRQRRRLDGGDDSNKGDLPAAYHPGDNVFETMQCNDLPTIVPHRAGLWMYTVSSDPGENRVGCPVPHDPQEPTLDNGAWNKHYKIGGALGSYSLPDRCTGSKSMEIMERNDNPNITIINNLVDWVDASFQHNTQALIVLMQLYFEPKMKWDTFATLLIEKDTSGRYLTSDYYLARDYRPSQNVHKTKKRSFFYNITIFIMLIFFAWWAGGITKALGCECPKTRFIALSLFPWAFYQSFMAVGDFEGQAALAWILAVPYLVYSGTCIISSIFRFRYNTLSKENRRRNRRGAGAGPPPTGGAPGPAPTPAGKGDSGLVLPADSNYSNVMLQDGVVRGLRAEEVKHSEGEEKGATYVATPTTDDTHTPTHTHTHTRGVRSATEQPLLRSMSAHHTKPAAMMHDLHAAGKGRAVSYHPRSAPAVDHQRNKKRRRGSHNKRPAPVGWAEVAREYATDACVFVLILALYIMMPLFHHRQGTDFLPYVLWLVHIFVRVSVRIWKYHCPCSSWWHSHPTDSDDTTHTHAHTLTGPITPGETVVSQGNSAGEKAPPRYDFDSPVEGTFAWDTVDICLIMCSLWMFVAYAEFVHNASNIRSKWELSAETAAFMAARGAWLTVPFSLVLFLVIVRTLRYLEIFPILAVPWATFTRCLHELLAYSVVFVIITMSFSLLFMFNLGGDTTGVSGLSRAMMTMLPNIFGGNIQFMTTGVPTKQFLVLLINTFYAFTTVFFVTNILLALVLAHYEGARNDSNGVWIDHNLLEYAKDKIHVAKRMAPHGAKPLLDRLENRVERHSIKLRKKSSLADYPNKQSVDLSSVPEGYGWDLSQMPTSYTPHAALGDRPSSVGMSGAVFEGASDVRFEQLEKQLSTVQHAIKRQENDRTEQKVLLERISSLLESMGGCTHASHSGPSRSDMHQQQQQQQQQHQYGVAQEIEHDGRKSSAPQLT